MKIFFKKTFILILFLMCFSPAKSLAADISISPKSPVNVGENFEILVNANTDGIPINSVDIILDYNQELMSFVGYKSESTVVDIWIESPNEQSGYIYLSGIIPGGVSGLYNPNIKRLSPIPIVRLIFNAKKGGNAVFDFTKAEIFKNDGKGTQLIPEKIRGEVEIKNIAVKKDEKEGEINVEDREKPEPFSIIFFESSMFSKMPSMIIFKTNDAGSGIKEYKINMRGSIWESAKSPKVVSKGIFPRDVTIRAFDFYGNFEDSSIRLPGLLPSRYLWLILGLLTMACILGYKLIKYKT